jgi:hypothetical protein
MEMKIGAVGNSYSESGESAAVLAFEERSRLRADARKNGAAAEDQDAALRKVEETRESNTKTTLQMMDRHNEMVKKSQELNKEKEKRRALERQNQEHREEQRVLLAEMALRNAERGDILEAARLRKENLKETRPQRVAV